MPITTNAKAKPDVALAKDLVKALKGQVGDDIVDVKFFKTLVRLTVNDDDPIRLSRSDFMFWAEAGYPWENDAPVLSEEPPEPEGDDDFDDPPEQAEAPEPVKPEPAEAAPAAPQPKKERKAAPIGDDVLEDLANSAFLIEEHERGGKQGRNEARFQRGELMIRLRDISQASKRPMKELLSELNTRTLALASENAITGFATITESEASDTRRVVSAFGGSGEFQHVFGVNPGTGQPMVADDGRPIRIPLTQVALNKLVPLAEYVDDEADPDRLVSFAHSTTEKVVKKAKSVAKKLDRPMLSVINDITKLRVRMPSPLGPDVGEIEVPPDEKETVNALREMVGEKPQEDIATLRTSRGWYEGTWLEIKETVSAICRRFNPSAVAETTNEVSNVYILERILTAYYHPQDDDGVQRLLGMLVASEEIAEAQANEWINTMARDPETGEWERAAEAVTAEDADTAAQALPPEEEDGPEGDDDIFDEEFEIDDPVRENDDDFDEDDDDDF